MSEIEHYPSLEGINVEAEIERQARKAYVAKKHIGVLGNLTAMASVDREDAAMRYRQDAATSIEKMVELAGKSGEKGIEALFRLDPKSE